MASSDQGFFRRAPFSEKGHEDFERVVKGYRNEYLRNDLRRALEDSRPTAQSKSVERGLLIRENSRGDVWAESFFPKPNDGRNEISMPPPRTDWQDTYDWIVGARTIGIAHTHPSGNGPSKNYDEPIVGRKFPGIIVSPNGMYYYGQAKPPRPVPGWQFWR